MKKELLFQIITPQKNFKIFTNGEIEGFPQDAIINNRFPAIIDRIQASNLEQQDLDPEISDIIDDHFEEILS